MLNGGALTQLSFSKRTSLNGLQDSFDLADRLGCQGLYFEAHEELETAWRRASGSEKIILQGLIQIAAGLHRLRLDPRKPAGAFYLLERGLAKLDAARELTRPRPLAELKRKIKRVRDMGEAPATFRFGLRASE